MNQIMKKLEPLDYLLIVLVSLAALLCLAPIWYTVVVSVSDKAAVAAGLVRFIPVDFTWISYQTLLGESAFFRAFGISLERVLLGGALNFVLTILVAYPLSQRDADFRSRRVYVWVLIFTMLFNGGLIPTYLTIKSLGLMNSIWALVLPTAVPVFNVILLTNFFRSIPRELREAGVMDGAGPWYLLLRMYVPLALPALATVTLFSVVGHWNSFFDGFIYMNRPEHYPLQTYIQQLVVQINMQNLDTAAIVELSKISNKTLNAAKIVISMIPILLIYPFLQRYFIHGIMIGSVKE
ncbi:carbohydrate ABC transporter permease [Paenibacillus eucommiae]|uniref:ABC-type glycerol-3-phosphate transport system permease component n=1 Tax=Paenibacillus eucommiae TaxID=1355755 RepID=A0ABS4IRW0_9BACL|nr:carbohydrate ABC transporter permease [Paenibacillus eucommiae]MBP1990312.1 ABC-type glycerol-3-phosphate transport system permease component [Paenibacillus eucommiae]